MKSILQQGHKNVLVNLERVSYMDSAGLGELVQAYSTVSKQGGSLKLMSEVLAETVPQAVAAVLSGPSFAGEVARGWASWRAR